MALSPGEQALVDRGVPVTSTSIPAAARDRINAAIAIKDRVTEIQAAEGGDTERARYLIATEAQKAGVSADQIADALGGDLTGSQIGEMARSVGIGLFGYNPPANSGVAQSTAIDAGRPESETSFEPSAPITREGLESLYINLLGRTPGDEALEYWLGQDVNPNINTSENPTDLTTFGEIESAISDAAQAEYVNRQASLVPGVAEPTTTQEFASLVAAGQNPYQEGSDRYAVMDYFIRNPQATDEQIAAAMAFSNVSPQLVADVTAVPIEDVISRYDIQRRASVLGEGVPTTPGQPTVPGQGPGGAGYTPGGFQYTPFDYTNMAAPPEGAVPSIFSVGGVFGPGQGMPQVPYVPGVDTGLGAGPAPSGLTMAPGSYGDTGTTAPGSRTLVSPGITTYAYPQPFGNIDIFNRPGAQAPNTTTQQDMTGTIGDGLANLSPAQRALLGSIFG
jgi:hypothetical protein